MSHISKTVKHVIRMGEYESLTVEVTCLLDIPEGIRKETVLDELDEMINEALDPELKEARKTCADNSYVLDWRK